MKKLLLLIAISIVITGWSFSQEKIKVGNNDTITGKTDTTINKNNVFFIVTDMPVFKNGDKSEFRKYIQQNLKYPKEAAEKGIDGRVFVSFIVNTKGKVVHAKIVKSAHPLLDKEALRVINSSPKWKPGKQKGEPVNVAFTFPIVFVSR